MAVLGKVHIDIVNLDKRYKSAFKKMANGMGKEELRHRWPPQRPLITRNVLEHLQSARNL